MIEIASVCGSCKGLTKTLTTIYEIYEKEIKKENPKNIYLYHNYLNNNKVLKELNDIGIKVVNDIRDVSYDDIVILSPYGSSREVYEYLDNNNIEYYDSTCSNIDKIRATIQEKIDLGYEIVIIGDYNYFETKEINEYFNNEIVFIKSDSDFLKLSDNKNKYIMSGQNVSKSLFTDLTKKLKTLYDNYNLDINNSYCLSLNRNYDSSEALAKKSDLMIIVDDDQELFNRVSARTETYVFKNIRDLIKFVSIKDIDDSTKIGITGSIWTPVKEIYNYKYLLEYLLFYKKIVKELEKNQDKVNNELLKDNDNEIIQGIVKDFIDLNKDGKYIRGVLIALGSYMSNSKMNKDYLDLAYAYEMFQTSVLIHDDIIDNAKIRRGKETIPRRICHNYLNVISDKEYQEKTLKLANSIGICTGDLGFYEANNIIVNKYKNHKNLSAILKVFNDIVIKTIKGEMLDVYLPFKGKYFAYNTSEEEVLNIYNLKTSYYTLIGPVTLGYLLNNKEIPQDLVNVLNRIGVSFQIKDDLLGIFGNKNELGKSNISDIEEFKQTILYSHIINTPYKQEFLKLYGSKNLEEKDILKVQDLLKTSGSYNYALNRLDELSFECFNDISELEIDDKVQDILKGLLIFINIREK